MPAARRIGALLLLVGGVLETARLIVFTLVSPVWPIAASVGVNLGPTACIAAGLIAFGLSVRGRARAAVLVAGVLDLVAVVVDAAQMVAGSPSGPGPSFLTAGAAFVAIVVAAVLLLADRSLVGPARWAVALPAAGIVLLLVSVFAPPLGAVRIDLLPGIGFAIAGALLLRRAPGRPLATRTAAA